MRIGVLQTNFIPWRGYFDFIDDCDVFVVYDIVQYTKNDWRNRNRIKTPQGPKWVSVPVTHDSLDQRIDETPIAERKDWPDKPVNQIRENYRKARFFDAYFPEIEAILRRGHDRLSALNRDLIGWACDKLSIETRFEDASAMDLPEDRNERLLAIMEWLGGTVYLSGAAADSYLDKDAYRARNLGLEYKVYDYPDYPQLHGDFEGAVTVLDLLFNTGPNARGYLKSRKANDVIVPPAS